MLAISGGGAILTIANDVLKNIPDKGGERLWPLILSRFAFSGAFFTGSIADFVKRQINGLQRFLDDSSGISAQFDGWATYAMRALRYHRDVTENWEFIGAFWDGKPSAEEAIAILERPPEDQQRRGFVRRLLEEEKKGLARKILGDEEIRSALEYDPEIAPRTRRDWEALILRRVPAWKS